ncbi:gliding motility-associated C-terminal domain-containing protein [Elusimicrobiota bacterium]
MTGICLASGQTIWTSGGVAVATGTIAQDYPQIISDGSCGAIMCWQDETGADIDIYAQAVNSNGSMQWTLNGIIVSTMTDDQIKPVIATDGSGGAIIAWWDKRSGTNYGVYAQRIDSSGDLLWDTEGVAASTDTEINDVTSYNIGITTGGYGSVILAWVDSRNENKDIYTQKISSAGEVLWGQNGLAVCSDTNMQDEPVIVSDTSGGAIIAWIDIRNGEWDVYCKRISSSGTAAWAEKQVFSNTNGDKAGHTPDIAMVEDGAGGAIICWQEEDASDLYDIYALRVNSDGSFAYGGTKQVVSDASGHQMESVIIRSQPAGTCIVAWRDFRNEAWEAFPNTKGDVYAVRLDANGSQDASWTPNGVLLAYNFAGSAQEHIRMISDGAGGAIISWQDKRNAGTEDIYSQKIEVDMSILAWGNEYEGSIVSTFTYKQKYPQIVSDGINGALICWEDERPGSDSKSDIYVQRITDPDTDLPENITTLSALAGLLSDEVVLSWTAPDEDNIAQSGNPVHHYNLKYSTHDPTGDKSNWWYNTADKYNQSWTPLTPGATDQKKIYLLGDSTYYFLMQAVDDANNKSGIESANIASAVSGPDIEAPSKIQNFTAETGSTEGIIDLSWNSPGDNGTSQTILRGMYHIQHSTDVTVTWSTASAQISYSIRNIDYGVSQSTTVVNLLPGVTYYFHMWTEDEVPNVSLLSNGATAWAQLDVTPPGKVTDLTPFQVGGSSSSIKLTWTAPGDDGYVNYSTAGPVGFSGQHIIQYSTFTGVTWSTSSAFVITKATSNVSPGDNQNYIVTGLNDDTDYHFRLWTRDESNNLSAYTSIASTKTPDVYPPCDITTLSALSGAYEGQVDLSWTAPGDNGQSGTAHHYEIRQSSTVFVWSTAVLVSSPSVSGPYGTAETYTAEGLNVGVTYYFELRAYDEVLSSSSYCNRVTALAPLDLIAPATVLDLAAASNDSYITLQWTAPGDNGDVGYFLKGGTYTIRYSSIALITAANWDNSDIVHPVTELSPAPTVPVPNEPGASETATITGLTNFVEYWFALKTKDEVPHESGLSNVVKCMPTPDQTPPKVQLTLTPPEKVYVLGNKLIVKAKGRDSGGGVTSMKLYYRKKGKKSFKYDSMYSGKAKADTKECSGEIPAKYMTADGVEYYVEVMDKAQNWRLSSGQSGVYPSVPSSPKVEEVKYKKVYKSDVGADGDKITLPDGNPDDGDTFVKLPAGALKEDIKVSISQKDADKADKRDSKAPVAVYDFTPDGRLFKKPVTISILYFDLDDDGEVDDTKVDEDDLKIFHWDGFEWRLIGGKVDSDKNTVTAKTMHFSLYGLFEFTGTLAIEDTNPLRKIITPNGDGINDFTEFSGLEPPYELNIHNIRGRIIKSVEDISSPTWDGTDDDGDVVESGIYIYQLKKDGETLSGVIIVGK